MGDRIGWNSSYGREVKGGKAGEADTGHLGYQSLHLFPTPTPHCAQSWEVSEERRELWVCHVSLPKNLR